MVPVDVCDLLSPGMVSDVVAAQLRVVGVRIAAPRLETLRCDFGRRFAEPIVTVQLTTDPVALEVFSSAYGEDAGGDPRRLRRVGGPTVLRSEGTERATYSFVHGAVVSVSVDTSLLPKIGTRQLAELARIAVKRLPDNPVLAERADGDRCGRVATAPVVDALGRPVSLQREFVLGSSVLCSWGAQPGALVVSATTQADDVGRWRRTVATDPAYAEVPGFDGGSGVAAYSSDEQSGDLVVIAPPRVYRLSLVPAAGFAGSEVATTPAEQRVAEEMVRSLR